MSPRCSPFVAALRYVFGHGTELGRQADAVSKANVDARLDHDRAVAALMKQLVTAKGNGNGSDTPQQNGT